MKSSTKIHWAIDLVLVLIFLAMEAHIFFKVNEILSIVETIAK